MPFVQIGRNRVNYGLQGNPDGEVIVFLNGLTQTNSLWTHHRERLAKQGYRVLTYDMLGQGLSSKPVLGIRLEDHAKLLCQMLDALKIERCYLAGISYGGVVALHTTIHFPERVKGLIAMSTFCEMPGQLEMLGRVFHMAITQAGFPLIQSMLLPMNFSSKWIDQIRNNLPEHLRRGYVINDPYAIQNLMESYVNFQPFTQDLAKIQCPTLILNGEFDFLTPRLCHETLRQHIESSRLMIIPQAFHAFTLEYPEITVRVLEAFVRSVEEGTWKGDKSVWVASEDPQSEVLATRCVGDHMRAVFVSPPSGQLPAEEWRSPVPEDSDTLINAKPASPAAKPAAAPAATKPKAAARKTPTKPARGKSTPAKGVPVKPTAAKAASTKPEIVKSAPAKSAAAKTTPTKAAPGKSAPAKAVPSKATPSSTALAKGTAAKAVSSAPTVTAKQSITATVAAAARAKPIRAKGTPAEKPATVATSAKPTSAPMPVKAKAKAAIVSGKPAAKTATPSKPAAAPKPAKGAKAAAPAAKTRGGKAASPAKG
ncbi:MAG: alpha/beta fold hydrolase [Betaproteobacteria bacterium]